MKLLSSLLWFFLAASLVGAADEKSAPPPDAATATNEVIETEYQKVLALDDAAQTEVDQWIRENQAFRAQGGGVPDAELNRRIAERRAPVQQAYLNFLTAHPNHARAHVSYGSFLNDTTDAAAALAQWEIARGLDPSIPAVWNNLANYYAENGPTTNAFADYAKAIELNPHEPLYYHNLGRVIYLFNQEAAGYFHLTEAETFAKVLTLYRQAQQLAPDDFPLASDIAQTYNAIRPFPADAALQAWNDALRLAHDDVEREGVRLHLARIKIQTGALDAARTQLTAVTNAMYASLKAKLLADLELKANPAAATNAPAATSTSAMPASAATNAATSPQQ
ncbi:MAG TPA: hypothetical protein VL527_03810 [Dongiaceae bacterium]|nr:hypothetical protein [Dongiaceae bacterium]